jgi:hypothetical protein
VQKNTAKESNADTRAVTTMRGHLS